MVQIIMVAIIVGIGLEFGRYIFNVMVNVAMTLTGLINKNSNNNAESIVPKERTVEGKPKAPIGFNLSNEKEI